MPPDYFSEYQLNPSAPIHAAPNERYQKTLSVSLEYFEKLSADTEQDKSISEDDKNKFAKCLNLELIKLIGESGKKDLAGKNIWQPNEIAMLYQTLRKMGLDENTSCSIITKEEYQMRRDLEDALSSLDTIPDQYDIHPPNRHRLTNFKTIIQFLKQNQHSCIGKKDKSMDQYIPIDTGAVKASKQKLLNERFDYQHRIRPYQNHRDLYLTPERLIDEKKITPLLRNIIESIEQCHDKDEKIKRESMLFECLLSLGIEEPRLIGQLLHAPSNDLCSPQTVIGGSRLDNIHTRLSKLQVNEKNPLDPYAQLTGLLMEFTSHKQNKNPFMKSNDIKNTDRTVITSEQASAAISLGQEDKIQTTYTTKSTEETTPLQWVLNVSRMTSTFREGENTESKYLCELILKTLKEKYQELGGRKDKYQSIKAFKDAAAENAKKKEGFFYFSTFRSDKSGEAIEKVFQQLHEASDKKIAPFTP